MSVKGLVRNQLETLGLNISRRTAGNGSPLPLLRLLIEHCILVEGTGTVIQIGANDGLMYDPIHESIVEFALPAVLVEPLPDLFEQLQRNYAGVPNIRFENVAVSTVAGEAEIFRVNPSATHFPEWTYGLASFDKSVLLKHKHGSGVARKDFEQSIVSVRVPVITIRQLLQKHSEIEKILMLQIDTEGHDFVVVKSAVEAGCLPRIINYEHKHLSYNDQAGCRDLLAPHGYSFLSNAADTLAYKARA